MKCPQCHAEHTVASTFCSDCGALLPKGIKTKGGNQRECQYCGQFNKLDARFCVSCGEEMIGESGRNPRGQSKNPSYKTIALAIGIVLLVGFSFKLGQTLFNKGGSPVLSDVSPAPSLPQPALNVEASSVIAVAKHFKCPCGGCGELPLATCECDMPKGAVEVKHFIRGKLAEGFSVDQVIELVDKRYGHRI
jgi:hypothetical protein